ncbi:MAG TPA: multidrug efflux SMR transporter [Pseudoxanthomonas sp.]|nr:multidrug efflux SMR transporter [Pseudoxanthomonas sp.]
MGNALAWSMLLLAGVLDVLWALAMKQAEGYTRLGWSLASFALLGAFVWLLGKSLSVLPIGTAYAVWTGIGAVGTVAAGAWLFGESLGAVRLLGVALVVAGIVVLKLAPG